ncbi:MAG: hypothetical protein H6665_15865 [Ardenticatenaceae bacterium]|nr:hypothetical protein [Ardenticatenaceae bacterium]
MKNLKMNTWFAQSLLKKCVLLMILFQPACQQPQPTEIQKDESDTFIVPTATLHVIETDTSAVISTVEPSPNSSDFPQIPFPRSGHAMVYDPLRQKVVLFGGSQIVSQEDHLFNRFNDTWEYDGTNWIRIETRHSPESGFSFALIYDEAEEKVIAFGSSNEFPKPWQYDGQDWQQIDVDVSLLPPSAVYFPKTGDVITPYECWQKCDASFYMTWHFDGQTWFEGDEIFPYGDVGQNPLFEPRIVYDSYRDVVVFQIQWPWTFEFDGQAWTLIFGKDDIEGNLPPLAGSFNMIYDSYRRVVVLFGMVDGESLNRTWEYDGKHWEEIELEVNPPPRGWSAMAFDEARGVTVLFGGEWDGHDLNDLWEYDGQTWVQR